MSHIRCIEGVVAEVAVGTIIKRRVGGTGSGVVNVDYIVFIVKSDCRAVENVTDIVNSAVIVIDVVVSVTNVIIFTFIVFLIADVIASAVHVVTKVITAAIFAVDDFANILVALAIRGVVVDTT